MGRGRCTAEATEHARRTRMRCTARSERLSGVGNIIKNEVLFRIRVHPLSKVGALSPRKLRDLVEQARQYSFEFLEWKKAFVLRKHWLVQTRRECPRCHIPLSKAHLGVTNRRSFYCEQCQIPYGTKQTCNHLASTRAAV